jgi:CMP-N,N'-diacetyllegionaminic acid synthase
MRTWAVIPARGGSRRLRDKNIRLLNGKPLLAYTLLCAQAYDAFERILVSTDSERIRREAEQWGGEVPFMRPAELAEDDTPTVAVLVHLLSQFSRAELPDAICLLQPTSPLRKPEHIGRAVEMMEDSDVNTVVSVSPPSHHPNWMKTVNNGFLVPLLTGEKVSRHQDISSVWNLNGALYLVRTQHLLRFQTLLADRSLPLIMNIEDSIDIDTELDFKLAELLIQERDTNACVV